MEIRDYRNIDELLREAVAARPEAEAYRIIRGDGTTSSVDWRGFADDVDRAARSLLALGVGYADAVSISSFTRYEWVVVDLAAASIGSRAVGIYQTLTASECRYIVDHSDSVLVFAEDAEQVAKLRSERGRLPRVRRVVVLEPEDAGEGEWTLGWERFLELGSGIGDGELAARREAVGPEDVAAIVYTSGTTGVPKGAMLTHDNVTFTVQAAEASLEIREGDVQLLFLPLAHIFARMAVFLALYAGNTLVFGRSLETVADDLRIARPHWFASVPRLYEKVRARVMAGAEEKGGLALAIFRWAFRVGREVSEHLQAKRRVPLGLRVQNAVAHRLVFSKLHAALGGRLRWAGSGAAPLDPEVGRFFHAAGVLILEGIGMTENSSLTNVNRVDDYRFGWVGPPIPGVEQRTAADGEVLFRGRNVMAGYYKMPEETAETIDPDGWLHTGDLGEIDERAFLRITGRKKDLIITAGGKNVAPTAIEGRLTSSKYVAQACVVGDRRKHLAALVTLDRDNVAAYARSQGIEAGGFDELRRDHRVRALVQAEIDECNRELASFETIKKFAIVDEFTIENGLLTPTMKLKRHRVEERHGDLIDGFYDES